MKRALTPQEKRTIRLAAIVLGIYLVGFAAFLLWKGIEKRRAEYNADVAQAAQLRETIQVHRDKAALIEELMARFHMDPTTLSRTSIVAQASAAIQKAATEAGVNPGTIRESSGLGAEREIATIQVEGSGPAPAVMSLLYHMERLGFPLLMDSLQLTSDPRMPGAVKLNLTIVILDFEQWRAAMEDKSHA